MIVHPKAYAHMLKHDPPQLDCEECWRAWGISRELRAELQAPVEKPAREDAPLKPKAP